MAADVMATAGAEVVVEEMPVPSRVVSSGPPPRFPEPPDDSGGGDDPGDDDRLGVPFNNARLGVLMFLGAETMFFAGLVGAFLVYRLANEVWPPTAMPRLPVAVTGINTLLLLASALTMWRAQRAVRRGAQQAFVRLLVWTLILGVLFLAVQGYEWVQLIRFGLTLSSGVYGATFYVLIGSHALHVFGAVLWLAGVWRRAQRQSYHAKQYTGAAVCGMYWYYVVALWPVLYWLVYLY